MCHSVPHVNLANYSVVNFDRKMSKSLWVNLIKNLNKHFHQFFNFPQMPPARNKFKWSAIIIIRVNFFFSPFFCVGLLKNIFCSEYIIFWWKVRGGEGGRNHRIFVVLYWVEGVWLLFYHILKNCKIIPRYATKYIGCQQVQFKSIDFFSSDFLLTISHTASSENFKVLGCSPKVDHSNGISL